MQVLVTGAGGFSGGYVARALAAAGHTVTAHLGRDRSAGDREDAGMRFVAGDLSGAFDLPPAIDVVVHAAARSAWPGVSVDDMVRDNVVATRNLIARAQARTFVLFSSLSVHGRIGVSVVDEKTPVVDPDAYGLTKRLCEAMLEEACATGARGIALRLPGVLGSGSVRNWLTTSLAGARDGRDVIVANPDAPFNNAVHVSDLARLVGELIVREWSGFDVLSLGAGGVLAAGEVARRLAVAGRRGSKVVVGGPSRPGYIISSARAQSLFGYAPMEIGAMLDRFIGENP